jgi:hypothetical protein
LKNKPETIKLKQQYKYKILLIVLILIGTWSCERDDICAIDTPTTPHIIIRLYDLNDPEELKVARELTVRGLDDAGNDLEDIAIESSDSITLPLRTINEPITSRFALEKDTDFRLDEDVTTESNIDIITVTYTPEYIYVSRACGYKSIFTNLSISVEPDGNNWILTNEILTTTIENENQAHVILRH